MANDHHINHTLIWHYDAAQFTSGTHYCEGQRLQSIYTSWDNPECTMHTHQLRSYAATFHKDIRHFGPGPASPSGQPFCLCTSGLNLPTTAAGGHTANGLGTVLDAVSKLHRFPSAHITSMHPVLFNACSSRANNGTVLNRQVRATAIDTHMSLRPIMHIPWAISTWMYLPKHVPILLLNLSCDRWKKFENTST